MSVSFTEEFKDAKINLLLEDYIELQKIINNIPDRINENLMALKNAIKEFPPELNESINLLADAVEEAESSYSVMAEKHRAVLNNQLDETRLELRRSIQGVVTETLKEAQIEVSKLAIEIGKARKNRDNGGEKTWLAIILLGSVSLISVTLNAYLLLKG